MKAMHIPSSCSPSMSSESSSDESPCYSSNSRGHSIPSSSPGSCHSTKSTSMRKTGRIAKPGKAKRQQRKVLEKLRAMVGGDEQSTQLEILQVDFLNRYIG